MSDRVLKCFNCGGEGHYAKDCQNCTLSFMQNVLKIGPTPTEEIELMTEELEIEIEQEVTPASIVDYQDISQENALNPERKDPEKIDRERNIVQQIEEKVLSAIIAKRVDILPETAIWVTHSQFRTRSRML